MIVHTPSHFPCRASEAAKASEPVPSKLQHQQSSAADDRDAVRGLVGLKSGQPDHQQMLGQHHLMMGAMGGMLGSGMGGLGGPQEVDKGDGRAGGGSNKLLQCLE